MHFPHPMHFSSLIVICPPKNPAWFTAPTGHTLLTGQNGDLSHLF